MRGPDKNHSLSLFLEELGKDFSLFSSFLQFCNPCNPGNSGQLLLHPGLLYYCNSFASLLHSLTHFTSRIYPNHLAKHLKLPSNHSQSPSVDLNLSHCVHRIRLLISLTVSQIANALNCYRPSWQLLPPPTLHSSGRQITTVSDLP